MILPRSLVVAFGISLYRSFNRSCSNILLHRQQALPPLGSCSILLQAVYYAWRYTIHVHFCKYQSSNCSSSFVFSRNTFRRFPSFWSFDTPWFHGCQMPSVSFRASIDIRMVLPLFSHV